MTIPLLVVDAANVIGSRPDGWWRDRAGAAARLVRELAQSRVDEATKIVLVLEGAARAAAASGQHGRVDVVHAPGSGDDEIVRLVAAAVEADSQRPVSVVTADRGLRARVGALGAQTQGPRWLWRLLDASGGAKRLPSQRRDNRNAPLDEQG